MNFHRCFLKVDHKDVLTILPVVVEVQSRGNGFTKMLGSVNGTPLQYSCLENPWMWAAVNINMAKSGRAIHCLPTLVSNTQWSREQH